MIPLDLLTSRDISPTAKILYTYFAVKDSKELYNRRDLCKELCLIPSRLHKALWELIDDGWIKKHSERKYPNKVIKFKIKINQCQTRI